MKVYKATNTLDGYLPPLDYTEDKALAEMILVGGKAILLDEFPKLRGIFKTGVGTDNLPFAEAEKRGIKIALPSEATCDVIFEETAAYACHLILAGLYAGGGAWDSWQKVDRPQLAHRRLLVVGAGRIGQRVMHKMKAFMQVDSFDIAQDAWRVFETKVRAADCISLHVPLTPETRNLFNTESLGWMKDGAVIVNTARGPNIDEEALFTELSAGRLRAAIDVFWKEPYKGHLAELPPERFIRSPHIASTCKEFVQGTADDFLAFMNAFILKN
jgi:phosphoglycerate dehydrogenase-like enzyme